jgi:hypothetical protein
LMQWTCTRQMSASPEIIQHTSVGITQRGRKKRPLPQRQWQTRNCWNHDWQRMSLYWMQHASNCGAEYYYLLHGYWLTKHIQWTPHLRFLSGAADLNFKLWKSYKDVIKKKLIGHSIILHLVSIHLISSVTLILQTAVQEIRKVLILKGGRGMQ